MKKIFFLLLAAYFIHPASAQVSINTTNTIPNSSSMLDITSSTKGLLIPRMTSAQRTAISSPAKGLMVYDSTANTLWYYDGAAWQEGVTSTNNLWSKNGNDIYNTNTSNVGIGANAPEATALLHVNTGISMSKGLMISGTYSGASTIPDLGEGSRMMFYPGKCAFRAGSVNGTQWNNVNVGRVSTAMGANTIASGDVSTAMGDGPTASGDGSTAMGHTTTASGFASTAMGVLTNASGYYSTAMGDGTAASGVASTAMGYDSKAKGFSSTVVGMFNDSILLSNQNSVTSTTPLFIIGNGDADNIRSNAMVVRKNGNVGIGTSTPNFPLNFSNSLGDKISLWGTGTYYGFGIQNNLLQIHTDGSGADIAFGYGTSAAFTQNMRIYGNGNATLAGILTQNSDARLKTNILPISNSMQQLMLISGYHYYWKNRQMDSTLQSGVLAQELQKVFPELVKEDANGTLSVNYSGLIPYVIQAAKEQQHEIDELKARLAKLEKSILKIRPDDFRLR